MMSLIYPFQMQFDVNTAARPALIYIQGSIKRPEFVARAFAQTTWLLRRTANVDSYMLKQAGKH